MSRWPGMSDPMWSDPAWLRWQVNHRVVGGVVSLEPLVKALAEVTRKATEAIKAWGVSVARLNDVIRWPPPAGPGAAKTRPVASPSARSGVDSGETTLILSPDSDDRKTL